MVVFSIGVTDEIYRVMPQSAKFVNGTRKAMQFNEKKNKTICAC